MPAGEKTKLLWGNPDYKKRMVEKRKSFVKNNPQPKEKMVGMAKKRWDGHIKVKKKYKYPEKKRFTNMRYKARKINAEGSHTFGEWEHLKKQYGYICPMCGKNEPEIKLTEDHIIPLSKGGSDNIENIQPLCVSCNTKKYTKIIKYYPIDKEVK